MATADRVQQLTTTTGTGTVTLSGSVTGFRSFADGFEDGALIDYTIETGDGSVWEVGRGTFTAPDQLARTTIYASSNADAAVNLPAGNKRVYSTVTAALVAGGGGGGAAGVRPVTTNSAATGTVTLDVATDRVFDLTQTGALTLSLTGTLAEGSETELTIYRQLQGAGIDPAVTWPAGTVWHANSGGAPGTLESGTRQIVFLRVRGLAGGSLAITGFYGDNSLGLSFGANAITFNPGDRNASIALSDSDKTASLVGQVGTPANVHRTARMFGGKKSGKWFFAVRNNVAQGANRTVTIGVAPSALGLTSQVGSTANSAGVVAANTSAPAAIRSNTSTPFSPVPATWAAGDIIMVAVDLDFGAATLKIWFGNNGIWYGGGSPSAGTSPTFSASGIAGPFFPAITLFHAVTTPTPSTTSETIMQSAAEAGVPLPSGFSYWDNQTQA